MDALAGPFAFARLRDWFRGHRLATISLSFIAQALLMGTLAMALPHTQHAPTCSSGTNPITLSSGPHSSDASVELGDSSIAVAPEYTYKVRHPHLLLTTNSDGGLEVHSLTVVQTYKGHWNRFQLSVSPDSTPHARQQGLYRFPAYLVVNGIEQNAATTVVTACVTVTP